MAAHQECGFKRLKEFARNSIQGSQASATTLYLHKRCSSHWLLPGEVGAHAQGYTAEAWACPKLVLPNSRSKNVNGHECCILEPLKVLFKGKGAKLLNLLMFM